MMVTPKKEREKRTLKSGRKCHLLRGATLNEHCKKQEGKEKRKKVGLKTWWEMRRNGENENEAQLRETAKSRGREIIFIRSRDCHHKKQYQQPEKKYKQQPTVSRLVLLCDAEKWPQTSTSKKGLSQLKGSFIIKNTNCDVVNNNNKYNDNIYNDNSEFINKSDYHYNQLFCDVSNRKHPPSWTQIMELNIVPKNKPNDKFIESEIRKYEDCNNNNNNYSNNYNNYNNINTLSFACDKIYVITSIVYSVEWCETPTTTTTTTTTTVSTKTTSTTTTHPRSYRQDKKRNPFFSLFYPEKTVQSAPPKPTQGYPHPNNQLSKCYARFSVDFCRTNTRTMTGDLIVRSGGSTRRFEFKRKIASYENIDANKNTDISSFSSSSASSSSSSSFTSFFPRRKNPLTKELKDECYGVALFPFYNTKILPMNIRLLSDGNCFRPGLYLEKRHSKKKQLVTEVDISRAIIKTTESVEAKLSEQRIPYLQRGADHKVWKEREKNKERSIVPLPRQYIRRNCYWGRTEKVEVEIEKTKTTDKKKYSSKRLLTRSLNTAIRIGTTTSIFEKKRSLKKCIGVCKERSKRNQLIAKKGRSSSRDSSSHSERKTPIKRGKYTDNHLVPHLLVPKFRESTDCQPIVDTKNGSSEYTGNLSATTSSEWTLSYYQNKIRMEKTSPGILNRRKVLHVCNNSDTSDTTVQSTWNIFDSSPFSKPISVDGDFVSCCDFESHEIWCFSFVKRRKKKHQDSLSSEAQKSILPDYTTPPSTDRSPQHPCGRDNSLIRPSPSLTRPYHNHHPNQQQPQKQIQQKHFPYLHKNNINISYYYDYYCDYFKKFAEHFSAKRLSRILPNWGEALLGMLIIFQLVGSSMITSALPVAKKKLSNEVKGMNYLTNFGYVSGPSQEAENLMSESVKIESIKRFQMFANLPVTGIFDHRTMEMMEKPRCGNSDKPVLNDWDTGRRKRYILSESKWRRTNLTFRFLNYTPDINFPKIRKAIYDAFLVWSRVTHLTFTEIMFDSNNGKDADIRIQFAKSFHNDGYPFDGEGIILAHAFFPGENKGGDTHFDDDEHWTVDSDEGVNLFMVAAHEFGHALGLSHSKTSGSLMYPWYQGKQSKGYQLPQDDVNGIQKLYGKKNGNETYDILVKQFMDVNNDSTDKTDDTGIHGNCTHTFDAITKIRGDVYIFKGKYFWRWTSGGLKDSKPILISHFWYHFPEESIDAAFERKRDSKIMFFKGDKYWLYDANHMERGWPMNGRPLVELGLPVDLKKIDAAFTWSFNKRTYLVSNDMYWKFDEMESYMVYDYPRSMTIWQDVPTPLDAAFQFTDNKTYFIKGKYYWEYEDQKMRVKHRTPSGNIAERWMQCPSESRQPPKISNSQTIIEATSLWLLLLSYFTKRLLA